MAKQVSRLPFDTLVPNKPLIAHTQLRGKLVSLSPFSRSTNLGGFSLASDGLTVFFELRGVWAKEALEVFGERVGRLMVVQSRGGERVEVMRQQRDRQGDVVPGARKLKVVFDEVIEGAWVDQVTGKKGETFRFSCEFSSLRTGTMRPLTLSRPPQPRKPRRNTDPRLPKRLSTSPRTLLNPPTPSRPLVNLSLAPPQPSRNSRTSRPLSNLTRSLAPNLNSSGRTRTRRRRSMRFRHLIRRLC